MYGGSAARKNNRVVCVQRLKRRAEEKLDVPLEAETSIGFNFFSSVFKHARSQRPFISPLFVCLREWGKKINK